MPSQYEFVRNPYGSHPKPQTYLPKTFLGQKVWPTMLWAPGKWVLASACTTMFGVYSLTNFIVTQLPPLDQLPETQEALSYGSENIARRAAKRNASLTEAGGI